MPAAAMATRRQAMPITPRTIICRMVTMITVITMTIITIMRTFTTTTSIAITSTNTAIPMLMTTSEQQPAAARSGMTESEAAALYRLLTWLSPSIPVGGFSYSSGVEWAVEGGDRTGAAVVRVLLAAIV